MCTNSVICLAKTMGFDKNISTFADVKGGLITPAPKDYGYIYQQGKRWFPQCNRE